MLCNIHVHLHSPRFELVVYTTFTVSRLCFCHFQAKRISSELHSNVLVELAAQIEQSTEDTLRDLYTCRRDLDRLHEKLVQIESEKDRERQLTKQRE